MEGELIYLAMDGLKKAKYSHRLKQGALTGESDSKAQPGPPSGSLGSVECDRRWNTADTEAV